MAEYVDAFSSIKDLVSTIAIIIGALSALFIYYRHAPVIQPKIIATWLDDKKPYLNINLQVHNKSKVRLNKPSFLFRVIEFELPQRGKQIDPLSNN